VVATTLTTTGWVHILLRSPAEARVDVRYHSQVIRVARVSGDELVHGLEGIPNIFIANCGFMTDQAVELDLHIGVFGSRVDTFVVIVK